MNIIINEKLQKEFVFSHKDIFPLMAMEELGELIQSISKVERYGNTMRQSLLEEIRDVYMILSGLQIRYGIGDDEVQDAVNKKFHSHKNHVVK